MSETLNFQQAILNLHHFWAQHDCIIWEPYNVQVGAGTSNPATLLRALGPEPWRVAYVEPSVRPDDGRFGDNPNRMQKFFQYQVILKPDPGNPQELYLESLEALGIDPLQHDIRFVEDNWQHPSMGAWGLGWEVWLDGQEITQFTYFQQVGGMDASPVCVEITYGLERIVQAIQERDSVWDISWVSDIDYREVMLADEVEHCRYYFDVADVDALFQVYQTYEAEVQNALENNALISAYDYVLKCSHLFNVLDTRGAIGVTERARYFQSMRRMTLNVARAYSEKREALNYPLMKMADKWGMSLPAFEMPTPKAPDKIGDVLLEIGVEEMPPQDVDAAITQLREYAPDLFQELRLEYKKMNIFATPRRIVVEVKGCAPRQADEDFVAKGPPAAIAFRDGEPTKAAEGFARSQGVDVADLQVEEVDGGKYVTARVHTAGRPATHVLQEFFPQLIADLSFEKSMRWNATDITFSRPIRWIVALFGEIVIPFEYAGVISGNVTHGLRPAGSPEVAIKHPGAYFAEMSRQDIYLNRNERRELILDQIDGIAQQVGGFIPDDPGLLAEVTNLVEAPLAFRGSFDEKYLALPREVLITVMRKHQRYFPILDDNGDLLPHFIGVRNGNEKHIKNVIAGNEHVIRARFSDAEYFYNEDIKQPLSEYLPRLDTLVFHEKLGSMLAKNNRIADLVTDLGRQFGMSDSVIEVAQKAGKVAKADLATQMVVEMTSLQGVMGREYALRESYDEAVAVAIEEHWKPAGATDSVPQTDPGTLLALTDRLDSLVGLFAAGMAPKSTSDPFGLRRAALGVVQILVTNKMPVDLRDTIDITADALPIDLTPEIRAELLDFIAGRLENWLIDELDAPRDVQKAVLAEQAYNPYRAYEGIPQLEAWVQRDNWETILDNFARCVRISRGESEQYEVEPSLFEDDLEKRLFDAYQEAFSSLDAESNVDAFLTAFEPMVPVIAEFFEIVMVNADDEAIRKNRLGLMQAIHQLQTGRADLSELTGF